MSGSQELSLGVLPPNRSNKTIALIQRGLDQQNASYTWKHVEWPQYTVGAL